MAMIYSSDWAAREGRGQMGRWMEEMEGMEEGRVEVQGGWVHERWMVGGGLNT